MAKATFVGKPEQLPINLELTPKEYETLSLVLRHVSGSPDGPRGQMDNIQKALMTCLGENKDTFGVKLAAYTAVSGSLNLTDRSR